MKVHYNDGYGAACGKIKMKYATPEQLTCIPRKVTCEMCKRTVAYKEMME